MHYCHNDQRTSRNLPADADADNYITCAQREQAGLNVERNNWKSRVSRNSIRPTYTPVFSGFHRMVISS